MSVDVRGPVAMINTGSHRADIAAAADDLERQGQPVTLVCLDRSAHVHGDTRADVLHLPLLSAGIASSLASRLMRDPALVLLNLLRPKSLVRLPVAVHLAQILGRRGITDVRGVDPQSARLASIVTEWSEWKPADLSELPVDWPRLGAHRVGVRWLSRRINSIAAEVSIDDSGRRVIVKRQRTHAAGTAAERWAHEYRVLSTLGEVMRDERMTVPRVLLFDEEAALLVMERAPGTTLDALFAAAAADHSRIGHLIDGIRGAGMWLTAMQSATRRSDDGGKQLLGELVSKAIEDCAGLKQQRSVIQRLETLQRRVIGRPLPVAGHHDDYWPGNIFFDGARVTVIDFESFRDGLALEDVAYFLIRCELLRRRFRVPLPDVTGLFFEGYSPGRRPDFDALRLFTLTKGLRSLARGIGDDLPLPQRLWTRTTIRRAVLRALQDSR